MMRLYFRKIHNIKMVKPRILMIGSVVYIGNSIYDKKYKVLKGFRIFNICFIYILKEVKND